mmetsp:Transcript_17289/g.35818  ORF Transcript_17289/g.35818 Transcript_17289/m.35818 type:complete len:243 (-) Transcript_17289:155-883(-)
MTKKQRMGRTRDYWADNFQRRKQDRLKHASEIRLLPCFISIATKMEREVGVLISTKRSANEKYQKRLCSVDFFGLILFMHYYKSCFRWCSLTCLSTDVDVSHSTRPKKKYFAGSMSVVLVIVHSEDECLFGSQQEDQGQQNGESNRSQVQSILEDGWVRAVGFRGLGVNLDLQVEGRRALLKQGDRCLLSHGGTGTGNNIAGGHLEGSDMVGSQSQDNKTGKERTEHDVLFDLSSLSFMKGF